MDNQFNQPGGSGGNPPQQPWGDPYFPGQQPPVNPWGTANTWNGANPYDAVNGTGPYQVPQPEAPAGNPYGQDPYDAGPYSTGPYGEQQPQQRSSPYDTLYQTGPYGGVQPPYQDPGAQQQPYSTDGYQHLFGQEQPQQPPQPARGGKPRGKAFAGAEAPQGFPGQKKGMSRSDIALIVVAMLAAVGFAVWYLYSTYAPEVAPYGQVATGSLSAIHSGSCLVVRNEIPYDAEGVNSIVYVAGEGSRIARNDLICQVYSSGYSKSAIRQLQEYRDDIRDYQRDLVESKGADTTTVRYNATVMTLAKEIRSVMAGDEGSLPNIESQMTRAVQERQDYFDKLYTSDQRYSRMKDDERSQTQRISSWTLPFSATTDALVSFYSDGFEYAVNGSNYTAFEPDAVRQMINGRRPENATPGKGKTTLYRMVKDNEWYALFLSNDTEWNPVVGETYELQLERFGDTPVTASVVSFTKSGGELLVRLRIVGSVEQVLYLRSCDAVLSESVNTLMVNERAIHEQDGMTGVVVVEGSTQSFIPVNVLTVQDGYAYFQTIQQGLLFEGMTVRLF